MATHLFFFFLNINYISFKYLHFFSHFSHQSSQCSPPDLLWMHLLWSPGIHQEKTMVKGCFIQLCRLTLDMALTFNGASSP